VTTLPEHLEAHLGPIIRGWRIPVPSSDAEHPGFVQVAQFGSGFFPGTDAYATLGVSSHALLSRTSGRRLRMEFLLVVPHGILGAVAPRILGAIAERALARDAAPLRGDVLPLPDALATPLGKPMLYAAPPVLLADEFGQHDGVAIVWLIPIAEEEAGFIGDHGWQAFEDALVGLDPPLCDPRRPTLDMARGHHIHSTND
jgi:hypothetical protein